MLNGGGAGTWAPDAADMSLNPDNRQNGDNKGKIFFD